MQVVINKCFLLNPEKNLVQIRLNAKKRTLYFWKWLVYYSLHWIMQNTCKTLVYYSLHWKALHPVFNALYKQSSYLHHQFLQLFSTVIMPQYCVQSSFVIIFYQSSSFFLLSFFFFDFDFSGFSSSGGGWPLAIISSSLSISSSLQNNIGSF